MASQRGPPPDGHADGIPGGSGEPTADPPVRWQGATPPVAFWLGAPSAGYPMSSLLAAAATPPDAGPGAWPGFVSHRESVDPSPSTPSSLLLSLLQLCHPLPSRSCRRSLMKTKASASKAAADEELEEKRKELVH